MLRRFKARGTVAPPPVTGTRFNDVTVVSENSTTSTEKTTITGGSPGAVLTFQITTFNSSDPTSVYFNIVGQGDQFLNSTFPITLDASGNGTYTSILYAGLGSAGPTGHGGGTFVVVTLISVSAGTIGNPSSRGYSKTT